MSLFVLLWSEGPSTLQIPKEFPVSRDKIDSIVERLRSKGSVKANDRVSSKSRRRLSNNIVELSSGESIVQNPGSIALHGLLEERGHSMPIARLVHVREEYPN